MLPQQWLVKTIAAGITRPRHRRPRTLGGALCCDARWRAPPRRGRTRWNSSAHRFSRQARHLPRARCRRRANPVIARLRKVGGRWNADAVQLVRRFDALPAHRAPPAARAPAKNSGPAACGACVPCPTSGWSHSAKYRACPGQAGTGTSRCAGPGCRSRLPLR